MFWGIIRRKEKAVVCDVLNISACIGAIAAARIVGLRRLGIMTDMPGLMVNRTKKQGSNKPRRRSFNTRINKSYLAHFTHYVFLTKQMNDVINHLPPTFRPQRILLSTDAFPINSSMKVKRYQVVNMLDKNPEKFSDLSGGFNLEVNEEEIKKLKPIIKRVIAIFREALGDQSIKIANTDHFILELGGDSFSYMTVVSNIEEEFGIVIPNEELGKLNTPIEFALYINKNK